VSTLHLADSETTVDATACERVAPRPDQSDVITVSFAGSTARWLDEWHASAGVPPRATVVMSDGATWDAGDPRERLDSAAPDDTDLQVELVDSPGNLTDLGVTLTELLESHDEYNPHTTLCLRSLTVLLQYSDSDSVYRFLHTLAGQLDRVGATGHFHLHGDAHDDDVVASLEPVFDQVVRDA